MKRTAENWNVSDSFPPLTNLHVTTLFSLVAVKKVKYLRTDQSARYSTGTQWKKAKYYADWSERSMWTVATESSKWLELNLESIIFSPILYNVLHMTSRKTERRSS